MPENPNQVREEQLGKVLNSSFKYLKIAILFFILPMWIIVIINDGTVLWKTLTWMNEEVAFLSIKEYLIPTILIFLFPIVYLIWFYYLVIKKILIQLNLDFFKNWNQEIGRLMATRLMDLEANRKIQSAALDFGSIIHFLNRKLSELPKVLSWIGKKIIDKIPLLELANSFESHDLQNQDNARLASTISTKLDKLVDELLASIVPSWTKFIIPINLIGLVWYIFL